jgi:tripartite-type tricarboxylate transporter receptor subunit TctC
VLKDPEVLAAFGKLGVEATGGTPEAFAGLIRNAVRQWGEVVNKAKIEIN